jgi:hypothetical protein
MAVTVNVSQSRETHLCSAIHSTSNISHHMFEGKIRVRVTTKSQNMFISEIFGSHSGGAEDSSLLGCYIMSLGDCLTVFCVLNNHTAFTFRPFYCFILKMKAVQSFQTSPLQCRITFEET